MRWRSQTNQVIADQWIINQAGRKNVDEELGRFGLDGRDAAGGFSGLAAAALGWLFVVAGAFDFARQPLALAKALEAAKQLLNRFIPSRFYLKHG